MREKKQDPKSEENAPSKRWSFWTRFLQKPPVFFRPVAGQPFFRSKYLFFVCWINLWIQRLQFDAVWYLAQNPDVAKSGLEPYTHYAHHGRAEGRPPGPMKESWEPFYEKNESREKNLLEDKPESQRIAVAVHCYYPELWPQIEAKLVALPDHFDLFITAPSDRAASVRALVSKAFPRARFFFGPDRGMDIAPFLTLIPTLMKEKYVAVCKLHTKKGDRGVPGSGSVWRQIMLETLVGSGENFSQAIHAFAEDPSV